MNAYAAMKREHQREFNAFPLQFAFSTEQFNRGMEALGLKPTDTDKVVSIGACGFMRKSDAEAFNAMNARHRREEREAMEADASGLGYIRDMFAHELSEHEFGYTYDLRQTLNALGYTEEQVNQDPRLKAGLDAALKPYYED